MKYLPLIVSLAFVGCASANTCLEGTGEYGFPSIEQEAQADSISTKILGVIEGEGPVDLGLVLAGIMNAYVAISQQAYERIPAEHRLTVHNEMIKKVVRARLMIEELEKNNVY